MSYHRATFLYVIYHFNLRRFLPCILPVLTTNLKICHLSKHDSCLNSFSANHNNSRRHVNHYNDKLSLLEHSNSSGRDLSNKYQHVYSLQSGFQREKNVQIDSFPRRTFGAPSTERVKSERFHKYSQRKLYIHLTRLGHERHVCFSSNTMQSARI